MIIKAFANQPLLVADDASVITFGGPAERARVYDFEFTSFADPNFACELEGVEKINGEGAEDKISTYDEEDEIDVLVSLMRVPVPTRGRNSSARSQNCQAEYDYINRKRNCSDFHSQAELSDVDCSAQNIHFSDRYSPRNINLLDDSIDEAIMNKNLSTVSFDADVVHDLTSRCLTRKANHNLESKRVKLSLDC